MLSVTVKTLDAQTKKFEIPDSIKIKEFKERISSTIGVPANQQRIIYQGRVLKDDHMLSQEYDGKVFHLVTKNPPLRGAATSSASTTSRNAGASPNSPNVVGVGRAVLGTVGASGNVEAMNVRVAVNASRPQVTQVTTTPIPSQGVPAQQHPDNTLNQQFRYVDRLMSQLNDILNQLEDGGSRETSESSPRPGGVGDGEVYANDVNMNQNPTPANTNAAPPTSQSASPQSQSGPNTSRRGRPTMAELGSYYTKMLELERRMEPHLNRLVEFLNADTAFTSTLSEEYRSTARLISLTLQSQTLLAEIQRVLSNFGVSLAQTPPRSLSFRMPHGPRPVAPHYFHHHHHHFPGPQAPRPVINQPYPIGFQAQVRPGMPNPRTVTVNQGVHMRLRFPNPGNVPTNQATGNAQAAPRPTQAAPVNQPTANTRTTHSNQQPNISIVVNASIQPRIDILVDRNQSQNAAGDSNVTATDNTSATQPQTDSGTAGNDQPMEAEAPVLPVIPGVPQDFLSNVFQSVAGSLQQRLSSGGQQPVQPGRIVVEGPPGGPNQMVEEISSIISQSVSNVVQNQLAADMNSTSVATETATQTAAEAANEVTTETTSQTSPQSSSETSTTTTSDTQTDFTQNASTQSYADALLSGGNFGVNISATQRPPPEQGRPRPTQGAVPASAEIMQQMLRDMPNNMFGDTPFTEFFSSLGYDFSSSRSSDPGILYQIFNALSAELSLFDILNIGQGNPPDLGRVREPIQNLLRQKCFYGDTPTRNQITEYAARSAESYRDLAAEILSDSQVKSDIDAVQSNVKMLDHLIVEVLNIIFHSSASSFSDELNEHFRYTFGLLIGLNETILVGGRQELVRLTKKCVNRQFGHDSASVRAVESVYTTFDNNMDAYESIVFSMAILRQVDRDTIGRFIVRKSKPQPGQQPKPVESKTSKTDVTLEEEARDSASNLQSTESESEIMSCESNLGASDQNGAGDSWRAKVPTEWVETIQADNKVQNSSQPHQLPFSEAYKAGRIGKKTKK